MPGKRGDLVTRFWAKVDRRGPTECWPWLGAVQSKGYGTISRGKRHEGTALAHHVAHEIQSGKKLRRGQTIDHTCVNQICMNDAHYDVCSRVENSIRRNARAQAAAFPAGAPDEPRATEADFDLSDYQEAA